MLLLLPPLLLALLPLVHAEETPEPVVWKVHVGKGYTCSDAEFRGKVDTNGTAADCAAAAQAMPACAGVNYATWPTSDPTVCYACRVAPGAAAKLGEAASMTSLVGPLPPVPPACPKMWRAQAFVRHFNFSVVPKRCGHIDMEPLLPPELSNQQVSDYLQITLDALGVEGPYFPGPSNKDGYLMPGPCGKVHWTYNNGGCGWRNGTIKCPPPSAFNSPDYSAVKFTKRNNPPSLPTPWVTAGYGPGQVGTVFASECNAVCKCTLQPAASGDAATPLTEAPPCLDSALTGMCKLCGQKFNDNLAQSLVQLYCDPTDPNC